MNAKKSQSYRKGNDKIDPVNGIIYHNFYAEQVEAEQVAPELQRALDAIDAMPANCPKSCAVQPDGTIVFTSLHKFFKCWINQTYPDRKLTYPEGKLYAGRNYLTREAGKDLVMRGVRTHIYSLHCTKEQYELLVKLFHKSRRPVHIIGENYTEIGV
jgi:hypothetical protein